jgi:hypothetical protein
MPFYCSLFIPRVYFSISEISILLLVDFLGRDLPNLSDYLSSSLFFYDYIKAATFLLLEFR